MSIQTFPIFSQNRLKLPVLLAAGFVLLWVWGMMQIQQIPLTPTAATEPGLGQQPLAFVPNAGQTDTAVRFQVRDMGGTIFFTEDEVVFALPGAAGSDEVEAASVRLRFVRAQSGGEVTADGPLPGVVNYFIGDDAGRWLTAIPTYQGLTYAQLYPGIDLHYSGETGALKSTYTVAPGIDPTAIRWRYEGAAALHTDAQTGALHITLADAAGSEIIEQAPIAWQEIAGDRVPVAVAYTLGKAGEVGFALGDYDAAYPLVIDPTLVYATYLGGSDEDRGQAIAVDREGNAYVTGWTLAVDFPVANAFRPVNPTAYYEAFVTSLDASGTMMRYSTYLGGSAWDKGYGIAVDEWSQAYITGETYSTDFPIMNPIQPSYQGGGDTFITQLDSGGGLLFSTYFGGWAYDIGRDIDVDENTGEVVVVGSTGSSNLPLVNSAQSTLGGWEDAFAAKFDLSGSAVMYSTYLGGEEREEGYGVALDRTGDTLITGLTSSANFPTVNAMQPVYGGGYEDAFVTRLDGGGGFLYSTYLGGSDHDSGRGIAVDDDGNAYVTGNTASYNFLVVNPFQAAQNGFADAFVTQLDGGGYPLYSTYLGGSDWDNGLAIAVGEPGQAYVTGDTLSANFPAAAALQPPGGASDAFVTHLDVWGNVLVYSTHLGGSNGEGGLGIAVDEGGDVYVTGYTSSGNFPTVNPLQPTSGGGYEDAFVAKITGGGASCQEIFAPGEIPTAGLITFDTLPHTTLIDTHYQATHGVTFENSSATRAIIYGGEPGKAHSSPNVADNDAVFPLNSSGVPMHIFFDAPKTHVGFWMGNGESEQPTAVLTAYDAWGQVVCQVSNPAVPEDHTEFIGIYDPLGRIRTIALDYGQTWLNESIDDLYYAP